MLSDEQFVKAMKALSEPKRLEIIRHVRDQEGDSGVTCTNILAKLDISQSTFSHHVTELREAQILRAESEGRTVKLSLNREVLAKIQEKIDSFR